MCIRDSLRSRRNLACDAHDGASRPGIRCDLMGSWLEPSEILEFGASSTPAHGKPGRADAPRRPINDSALDDAIFERVVGDHADPPSWAKEPDGRVETGRERIQLCVGGDAKGLERLPGRMPGPPRRSGNGIGNDGSERLRVVNGSCGDDGRSDTAGIPFFPKTAEEVAEVSVVESVDERICAGPRIRPHAHIDRTG